MGVKVPLVSKVSGNTFFGLAAVKAFDSGFPGSFFPSVNEHVISVEPDKVLWAFRAIMKAAGSKNGVILVSDERRDISAMLKDKLKDEENISVLGANGYSGAGLDNAVAEWMLKVRAYAGNTLSAADSRPLVYSSLELLRACDALTGEKPVTRALVYCGGEVASPGFYDVPLGTRYNDVVEACSPLLPAGDYAVLTGNTSGDSLKDAIETDVSVPVTKDTKRIIVLPLNHTFIEKVQTPLMNMIRRISSVCSQCRLCTDMCPVYLNGGNLYPHLIVRDIAEGKAVASQWIAGANYCISCGICTAVCPSGISPMQINEFIKDIIHESGVGGVAAESTVSAQDGKADEPVPVVEMTAAARAGGTAAKANVVGYASSRKLSAEKLAERFGLSGYEGNANEPLHVPGAVHTVNGIPIAEMRLSQAGGNATSVVTTGERVAAGDLIAQGGENGEPSLHAGIAGTVSVADKERIVIVSAGE